MARTGPACRNHPITLWFPTRTDPDNHGREGKAICAGCPVRYPCLVASLAENQTYGLAGGAGEDERRDLRRAWTTDGPEGPVWRSKALRHFRRLDGAQLPPEDRNGPQATHGLAVTYARGCRCLPCTLAASVRGAAAKWAKPWRWRQRTAA